MYTKLTPSLPQPVKFSRAAEKCTDTHASLMSTNLLLILCTLREILSDAKVRTNTPPLPPPPKDILQISHFYQLFPVSCKWRVVTVVVKGLCGFCHDWLVCAAGAAVTGSLPPSGFWTKQRFITILIFFVVPASKSAASAWLPGRV